MKKDEWEEAARKAGRKAQEDARRDGVSFFIEDDLGRIIKEYPDGSRFEIVVGDNGEKEIPLEDEWEDDGEDTEYCPHCGADLTGEPIPEEHQHKYGSTHFSRKIGIYDYAKDRIVEWECPDCHKRWERKL